MFAAYVRSLRAAARLRSFSPVAASFAFVALLSVFVAAPAHAQAPAAPSTVNASPQEGRNVIAWTSVSGATSYTLLRSTSTGTEASYKTGLSNTYAIDSSVTNGTKYYYTVETVSSGGTSVQSAEKTATPTATANNGIIALNAGGGSYTDAAGTSWARDYGYTKSSSTLTTSTAVSGTSDPTLFESSHVGSTIIYTLPAANGNYMVKLLFAEISSSVTAPKQRVFNVQVGSANTLTGFDIYAAAGGAYKAITRTTTTSVTSGNIVITFTGTTGQALVCGIEASPIPTGGGVIAGTSDPAQADVPPPGWAVDMVPTSGGSAADGEGPSAADSIDIPSGVLEHSPGPDLWAYNSLGPSAKFSRLYRTANAMAGYQSPGLSPGWTDNYDSRIVTTNAAGWYPLNLVEPNGGKTLLTPVTSDGTVNGTPTGAFTVPNGTEFFVTGSASSTKGIWNSITIEYKDRSRLAYTAAKSLTNTYELNQITNVVGRYLKITRDSTDRLTSISNDASTPVALLTWIYSGSGPGSLTTVEDTSSGSNNTRQVGYTFSGGNLSAVTQIVAPGTSSPSTRWQYAYTNLNSEPLLTSVQAPDPATPANMATGTTTYYGDGHVAMHTDAEGMQTALDHSSNGTGNGFLANKDSSGNIYQEDTQLANPVNADDGFVDAQGNTDSISYTNAPDNYHPTAEVTRNKQNLAATYAQNPSGFDNGNPATTTDPRGDVSNYSYAYPSDFPLGQVSQVQLTHGTGTKPDATREPTAFNYYPSSSPFNGLLNTVVSPLPGTVYPSTSTVTTTYTYDPTTVSQSGGASLPLGNVSEIDTPSPTTSATATVSTKMNYTTDGNTTLPAAVGEPLVMTDPNSNATHYRYDARGNRVTVIDASGYETDYYYNLADQMVATAYPATTSTAANRAVEYYFYQYPGGPLQTEALYSEGQLTVPAAGSAFPTPSNSITPFRYTTYTYGHEGETKQVSDAQGLVASYSYDAAYHMTQSTDGAGNATYYFYDLDGNLLQEQFPLSTSHSMVLGGGAADTLSYGYDADDNVVLREDGNGVATHYERGSDPDNLVTEMDYGGSPSVSTMAGQGLYSPDPQITLGNLPGNVAATGNVTYAYDVWGRMTSMADGSGTSYYGNTSGAGGYDDLDHILLTTRSFTGGPQGQTLSYAYMADGQPASMTLPTQVSNPLTGHNSGAMTYAYYNNGLLNTESLPWASSNSSAAQPNLSAELLTYKYQPNNWLQLYKSSLFSTSYTYNARGFLTYLSNGSYNSNDGGLVSYYNNFLYDAAAERMQESVSTYADNSASDWNRTLSWQYDTRGRLTQEASAPASGSSAPSYTENNTYDAADNLQQYKSSSNASFLSNADNQYDSPSGFSFTGSGTLSSEPAGGLFYTTASGGAPTFDAEQRLASFTSSALAKSLADVYDGDGLRAVKQVTTGVGGSSPTTTSTYFLYDALSDEPVAEETYTSGNATPANIAFVNAYGADGWRERDQVLNGLFTSYVFDPQGSVVNRVNSLSPSFAFNDVVQWDGWGEQLVNQSPSIGSAYTVADPVDYEGEWGYYGDYEFNQSLAAMGSYQQVSQMPDLLTHRYYDPSTGKFINRDPTGYAGGSNQYGYAGDDPINAIDPSGNGPMYPGGHHIIPVAVFSKLGLSKDVVDYFKSVVTSPTITRHTNHPAYSAAVRTMLNSYLKSKGLNAAQMTVQDASEFVDQVQKSSIPEIRSVLDKISGEFIDEAIRAAKAGDPIAERLAVRGAVSTIGEEAAGVLLRKAVGRIPIVGVCFFAWDIKHGGFDKAMNNLTLGLYGLAKNSQDNEFETAGPGDVPPIK